MSKLDARAFQEACEKKNSLKLHAILRNGTNLSGALYKSGVAMAQRRKKIWHGAVRGALYALLALYIIVLLVSVETSECVKELKHWLAVYTVTQTLHAVCFGVTCLIWAKAEDPSTGVAFLRIAFQIWIYLFEVVWVGYAASFAFSGQVAQCDERLLLISTIALVFLGFLLWIKVICGIVGACYILHRYRRKTRRDQIKK